MAGASAFGSLSAVGLSLVALALGSGVGSVASTPGSAVLAPPECLDRALALNLARRSCAAVREEVLLLGVDGASVAGASALSLLSVLALVLSTAAVVAGESVSASVAAASGCCIWVGSPASTAVGCVVVFSAGAGVISSRELELPAAALSAFHMTAHGGRVWDAGGCWSSAGTEQRM